MEDWLPHWEIPFSFFLNDHGIKRKREISRVTSWLESDLLSGVPTLLHPQDLKLLPLSIRSFNTMDGMMLTAWSFQKKLGDTPSKKIPKISRAGKKLTIHCWSWKNGEEGVGICCWSHNTNFIEDSLISSCNSITLASICLGTDGWQNSANETWKKSAEGFWEAQEEMVLLPKDAVMSACDSWSCLSHLLPVWELRQH